MTTYIAIAIAIDELLTDAVDILYLFIIQLKKIASPGGHDYTSCPHSTLLLLASIYAAKPRLLPDHKFIPKLVQKRIGTHIDRNLAIFHAFALPFL